uniref:Uncharacterized protein n=1 Tax=Myoviridae sp. ctIty1 TaxID=2827673 RepID=A0A8S5TGL5_9CAUD|nr:MAG TPA: hypothetical protein [Myoviridae sp. ctIty1]
MWTRSSSLIKKIRGVRELIPYSFFFVLKVNSTKKIKYTSSMIYLIISK